MLSVQNLSITYNDNNILSHFNLELSKGEIFALLGDSGSGKSSALRFIAGLDNAIDGDVILDSQKISSLGKHEISPEARGVGMVFQDYALFPHMNVEKNIAFGIHHLPKSSQLKRIKELLHMVDLDGIEKKFPHQLSGGEQQRVALARALAPSPKLLLLDEPFSSLDKNHRDQLVLQVRDILKKSNITSILVTHDQNEANTLADKVGIVQNKHLTIN